MIIDVHSHILPKIDDGSKNVETSIEMLRESANQGVGFMVATPHFYAHEKRIETFLEQRAAAAETLKRRIAESGEKLPGFICGAEVAFFEGMSKAEKVDLLTIEGTNLLLVEMPFESWSDSIMEEIRRLIYKRHFSLIIAHVERFFPFKGNAARIYDLMELPLYIQMNGEALTDFWHRGKYISLLKKDKIHLLGSDCHGMHRRPPNLSEAREYIAKKAGQDVLERIDKLGESLILNG